MLKLPPRWHSADHARHAVASQLRAHFYLRLHAFALFAWTLGIGYAASKIVFALGVPTFTERYMLSGTVGYLAFLLGVRIWLWHIDRSGERLPDSSVDGNALEMSARITAKNTGDVIKVFSEGASVAGDGCLPILLIAAGVILFAILVAVFGPELLIEVAFEAVLAGSLIGAMRLGREPDWLAAACRKTIWIFALVMLAMAAFGQFAQKHYPQATTARQVIHQMMQ